MSYQILSYVIIKIYIILSLFININFDNISLLLFPLKFLQKEDYWKLEFNYESERRNSNKCTMTLLHSDININV